MDLIEQGRSIDAEVVDLRAAVAAATDVVPGGNHTHWQVGGAPRQPLTPLASNAATIALLE